MSLPDDFETHPVGTGKKLEEMREVLQRIVSSGHIVGMYNVKVWARRVISEDKT